MNADATKRGSHGDLISIRYSSSSPELSCHCNCTPVESSRLALRPVGAAALIDAIDFSDMRPVETGAASGELVMVAFRSGLPVVSVPALDGRPKNGRTRFVYRVCGNRRG